MREFALDLIQKSAKQASARLQFARIAFGAAGSAGAEIDLSDAEGVARGQLEDDRTKLVWSAPRALMAKNRVKLLLNLLLIAQQSIPRGGEINTTINAENGGFNLTIRATGSHVRLSAKSSALAQGIPAGTFTAAVEKRLPDMRDAVTTELQGLMEELG